ncbi:MAG: methyltransferase domain-containing protein [Pseudomonadota bacterium]
MESTVIDKEKAVKSLYGDAATKPAGLCSPQSYEDDLTSHIPSDALKRNYGCGSPLLKAGVKEGETLIDLGSGVGIDCFVAAKMVGKKGKIIGIDMTDAMLEQANVFKEKVAESLDYDIVEFRKGYIEDLPVEDNSVDLVISNCVLNLSSQKEQVLAEILRVLRPGGRMIISDVVVDRPVDQEDKDDEELWAECYTGAIPVGDLVKTYEKAGFLALTQIEESFWREIRGYNFGSITLCAYKLPPATGCNYGGHVAVYMGPYASVTDEDGHVFKRFDAAEVCDDTAKRLRLQPYAENFQIVDIPELARPASSCGTGSACGTSSGSAESGQRETPCCNPTDTAAPCCDNNEPKADGSPCCDPMSIEQPADCGCSPEQLAIPEQKTTEPVATACCDSSTSCGTDSSCGTTSISNDSVSTMSNGSDAIQECCPCETEAQATGTECCDTGCGSCGCS